MQAYHTGEVPQDRETPVKIGRSNDFVWRYAYGRSTDSRLAEASGQDCLLFRYSDTTFVFALCDGVSQSFFGELAANLLAKALVDWLWEALPLLQDSPTIAAALVAHLKALTAPGTAQVQDHLLPEGLPRMLQQVLEEKRVMGSESTFVCGRIERPSHLLPDGRLVLAWMGDSRLRLWGPARERTSELGDTFRTAERWSTRRGPVGSAPHVFVAPLQMDGRPTLHTLIAYSDGLALLDQSSSPPSDSELDRLIAKANTSAASDDISFIEVSRIALEPVVPLLLPAPSSVTVREADGRLSASWSPVAGASHYQLEVSRAGMGAWQVPQIPHNAWHSSPQSPGQYALRVRAMQGQLPGEWSEVRRVQVSRRGWAKPGIWVAVAGFALLCVASGTIAIVRRCQPEIIPPLPAAPLPTTSITPTSGTATPAFTATASATPTASPSPETTMPAVTPSLETALRSAPGRRIWPAAAIPHSPGRLIGSTCGGFTWSLNLW